MTNSAVPEAAWWRIYDDPTLNALVAQALAANTDLRAAAANLKAAQAVLSGARNQRLPQTTVEANAGYGRNASPLFLPDDSFNFSGGFQLSYEADLAGRISRTVEAAHADAEAEAFARAAVQVRVAAAVTEAYLAACTAAEAISSVRSSVSLAADSARIVGLQQQAGSASTLDVVRAEGQLAQAQAELPPAENARSTALFELAALLGLSPREVPATASACKTAPKLPGSIAIGDGASLLNRRPDIAQAERRVAAATARVGVATADLYPRISIGASVSQAGGEGVSARQGFSYGIGPLLSFSFPNMGAARARIRQSEAHAEASLAAFDGVVLTALKEVEQALSGVAAAQGRQSELVIAEARADQAYRLADLRHRAGSIAYLDVIVAQGELLRLRLARTEADRDLALSRVAVFRALGSGWSQQAENAPILNEKAS